MWPNSQPSQTLHGTLPLPLIVEQVLVSKKNTPKTVPFNSTFRSTLNATSFFAKNSVKPLPKALLIE